MCSCCGMGFEWPRSFSQFQRGLSKLIVGCNSESMAVSSLPCSICSMEIPNVSRKPGILLCSSCAKEQETGLSGPTDLGRRTVSNKLASHVFLPENYKVQPALRQKFHPSDLWWLRFWAICLSVGVSILPVFAAMIYLYLR